MPKFLSLDGTDKNGIRAQVTVMTGTGTIKDIVGRGKQNSDGSYRNVEVEFDPDNPLLKRKVYGLLDTNAAELWTYIQQAHADGRTVAYRIESQRRNGVERTLLMEELNTNATENIRRILAAVDGHFSHEAKTDPAEDPDNENPSALGQSHAPAVAAGGGGAAVSPERVLAALASARQAGFPPTTIDTLVGHALAAGASTADVLSAGYAEDKGTPSQVHASFATEDKPWSLYNSDGRVNYGSYAVARAAEAEQFALDHLITIYTPAKSKSIDVTDEIVAQAASVALQLLDLADKVQVTAYGGGRPDRMKNSHARALSLVMDAVGKRYLVPVGGNEQAQAEWADQIVAEASERLYGLGEIVNGRLPLPLDERSHVVETAPPADSPAVSTAPTPPAAAPAADSGDSSQGNVGNLIDAFGGSPVHTADSTFYPGSFPQSDEDGFTEPDAELIGRLRDLCVTAEVTQDNKAISDWIERVVGVRSARKIDAPVLAAFCDHYEKAGPAQIRMEVLGS